MLTEPQASPVTTGGTAANLGDLGSMAGSALRDLGLLRSTASFSAAAGVL